MFDFELNFRTDGNSAPYLISGFSNPETIGTWMIDATSTVRIPGAPRLGGPFCLEITITPAIDEHRFATQALEIFVNDISIYRDEISSTRILSIDIPDGVINGDPITIVFHHPTTISSTRIHGHGDSRELSFCIWSLEVIGGVPTQKAPIDIKDAPITGSISGIVPRTFFQIRSRGHLGNRMFQYMVACKMAAIVPNMTIVGSDLADWGIHTAPVDCGWSDYLIPDENIIEWGSIVRELSSGRLRNVAFRGVGLRMENLLPVDYYRAIFRSPNREIQFFDERFIVINVRSAEIVSGQFPLYPVVPPDFYAQIVATSGLIPVFMGQIQPNVYVQELRNRFPNAIFLATRGAIDDFETVRSSKNIIIPPSTFSWLAAFLSEAVSIYVPLIGMYNPREAPDMDLLPRFDDRYHFYQREGLTSSSPAQSGNPEGVQTGLWTRVLI